MGVLEWLRKAIGSRIERYKIRRALTGAGASAPAIIIASYRYLPPKVTETILEGDVKPTIGWLLTLLGITDTTHGVGLGILDSVSRWLERYIHYLRMVETGSIPPGEQGEYFLHVVGPPPPFLDRFIRLFARFMKRNPARALSASWAIINEASKKLRIPLNELMTLILMLARGMDREVREVLQEWAKTNYPNLSDRDRENLVNGLYLVLQFLTAIAFGKLLTLQDMLLNPYVRHVLESFLGRGLVDYCESFVQYLSKEVVKKINYRTAGLIMHEKASRVLTPITTTYPAGMEEVAHLPTLR